MKRLLSLALLLLVCACDPKPAPPAEATPLEQAKVLLAKREVQAAIDVLETARQTQGEDPAVVKALVELYRAKGDEARAIQRAKAGLEAHPDAQALYVPLADMYFGIRQIDQAQQVLAEARRRGVDDANVSMLTGMCLANKNDVAGARAEFERARAAGADDGTVAMNSALLLLQENKLDEALAAFEALHAKHPKMAGPRRELARLLLARVSADGAAGKPVDRAAVKRAMDMLVDVSEQLKSDWRMHEAMGDGWMLEGDFDAAVASYLEALKLGQNPKSVEDRYRVAKRKQNEAKAAAAAQQEPPK